MIQQVSLFSCTVVSWVSKSPFSLSSPRPHNLTPLHDRSPPPPHQLSAFGPTKSAPPVLPLNCPHEPQKYGRGEDESPVGRKAPMLTLDLCPTAAAGELAAFAKRAEGELYDLFTAAPDDGDAASASQTRHTPTTSPAHPLCDHRRLFVAAMTRQNIAAAIPLCMPVNEAPTQAPSPAPSASPTLSAAPTTEMIEVVTCLRLDLEVRHLLLAQAFRLVRVRRGRGGRGDLHDQEEELAQEGREQPLQGPRDGRDQQEQRERRGAGLSHVLCVEKRKWGQL